LVAADRYHHDENTVLPAIQQGATVVCDRYVPSSLVLDPLDGIEREYVWNIYQRITVPDIAFILLAEASLCADRARTRGRYSRFHATNHEGSSRELALFMEALDFLRVVGYLTHEHDIGSATAAEVASVLADIVIDAEDGQG
jgi:dTMP kinase